MIIVIGRYLSDLGKKNARLLWGIKNFKLTYFKFSDQVVIDLMSYPNDRNLTSRYIFMMVKEDVPWKTIEQSITITFTIKIEHIICHGAISKAIWLKDVISRFKLLKAFLSSYDMLWQSSHNELLLK